MTEKAKNGQILLKNPICIMWYSRDAPGLANKILHPVKASRLPHTPPHWFDCDARAFEQFFPFWRVHKQKAANYSMREFDGALIILCANSSGR